MPELLNPAQTTMVGVPSAARPVAQKPQAGAGAAPAAPPSPSPFRPAGQPAARVLLLPHEETAAPARQSAGVPVRLAEQIRPVRLANPDDYHAFHQTILSNVHDEAPKKVYADFLDEAGHPHMAHAMREGSGLDAGRWLRHAREAFGEPAPDQMSPWREVAAGQFRHRADPNLAVYLNLHRHRTTGDLAAGIEPAIGEGSFYPKQLEGGLATNDMDYVRGLLGELTGPWNHISDRDWDKLQEWARTSNPEQAPERFAAAQAPPGGAVIRGVMYTGSQFLPKEAMEARPAPTSKVPPATKVPQMRDRLTGAIRRRRTARP